MTDYEIANLQRINAELLASNARIAASNSRLEAEVAALRHRFGLDIAPGDEMSLKEASFETAFHQETIRLWITNGQVRGRQSGGRWIVDRSDLYRFVGMRGGLRRRCA